MCCKQGVGVFFFPGIIFQNSHASVLIPTETHDNNQFEVPPTKINISMKIDGWKMAFPFLTMIHSLGHEFVSFSGGV